MAENNDSVIDLTSSFNFTLANHNGLNNVIINLDTDDSFREEESQRINNTSASPPRKRRYSKSRVAVNPQVPVHDLCTPDDKNKRNSKVYRRQSYKTVSREEPEEKKAKTSLGCCPICYEEFCGQGLASTKCGHVFCLECLKQALKIEPRCPTCRTMVKGKSGYHALYL